MTCHFNASQKKCNHAIKRQSKLDQVARFYTRKGHSPISLHNFDRSRSRDRGRYKISYSRECSQSKDDENIDPRLRYS